MRLLDRFRTAARSREEAEELGALLGRLRAQAPRAEALAAGIRARVRERVAETCGPALIGPAMGLVDGLLRSEKHFHVPAVDPSRDLSTSQVWALRADTRRKLAVLEHPERIERALTFLFDNILPGPLPASNEDAPLLVPLYSLIPQPALTVESVLGVLLNDPETRALFPTLCGRLEQNVLAVSGIDPTSESTKQL